MQREAAILKGTWQQLKGEAMVRWGKLTDDDWMAIDGRREKLVGRLQERYGMARQTAEHDVDEFFNARADSEFQRT